MLRSPPPQPHLAFVPEVLFGVVQFEAEIIIEP